MVWRDAQSSTEVTGLTIFVDANQVLEFSPLSIAFPLLQIWLAVAECYWIYLVMPLTIIKHQASICFFVWFWQSKEHTEHSTLRIRKWQSMLKSVYWIEWLNLLGKQIAWRFDEMLGKQTLIAAQISFLFY